VVKIVPVYKFPDIRGFVVDFLPAFQERQKTVRPVTLPSAVIDMKHPA
jgi:hypothetical protein